MWCGQGEEPSPITKKREVARSEQGTSHCQRKGLERGGLERLLWARSQVALRRAIRNCWTPRAACQAEGFARGRDHLLLLLATTCSGLAVQCSAAPQSQAMKPRAEDKPGSASQQGFLVTSCQCDQQWAVVGSESGVAKLLLMVIRSFSVS